MWLGASLSAFPLVIPHSLWSRSTFVLPGLSGAETGWLLDRLHSYYLLAPVYDPMCDPYGPSYDPSYQCDMELAEYDEMAGGGGREAVGVLPNGQHQVSRAHDGRCASAKLDNVDRVSSDWASTALARATV